LRLRPRQARFDGSGESFLQSTPSAVLASLGGLPPRALPITAHLPLSNPLGGGDFVSCDATKRSDKRISPPRCSATVEKIEKRVALAARWIEISLSPA
jgi:hypothetical protein